MPDTLRTHPVSGTPHLTPIRRDGAGNSAGDLPALPCWVLLCLFQEELKFMGTVRCATLGKNIKIKNILENNFQYPSLMTKQSISEDVF